MEIESLKKIIDGYEWIKIKKYDEKAIKKIINKNCIVVGRDVDSGIENL